jgi:hypothetical protein
MTDLNHQLGILKQQHNEPGKGNKVIKWGASSS